MTPLHVHELAGLKPDTLATYLAALGVLRLLASQKDQNARGFWRDEHFVLVSELDWDAIERFFLVEYVPTPILAPWNIESGFFCLKPAAARADQLGTAEQDQLGDEDDDGNEADEEGDNTDDAVGDPLLDRFTQCSATRLEPFRRAIRIAHEAIPAELRDAEKDVRRAREDMTAGLAADRASYEDAWRELQRADSNVAELKNEVEGKKAAAKGMKKGTPERNALAEAQQRLDAAKKKCQLAKQKTKEIAATLKNAEKDAKKDKAAKDRIAAAKKRFSEVQKASKEQLIAKVRRLWGVTSQEWVDAAVILDQEGNVDFTSLFGSGGNDGRMEFTKNLRFHLNELFDIDSESGQPRDGAAERLGAALFGHPTNLLVAKAVGQFFPGRAGGTNMGIGYSGGCTVNPWEFVLMLEGAIALVAGLTRRSEVAKARVSSPFWVEAVAAGFGSASQREGAPRGEQWLPLWSQPLRYDELVELIREGRAQTGRQQTTRAGDLVRATARLGLARGIDALQRFAYLERNGQSNLAVSTGRFRVASRCHQELLDEVAPWIDQLVRNAGDKNVPESLGTISRRTTDLLFAVSRQDASPSVWRDLFVTLGEAELALLRSGKSPMRRPLPRLSCRWLDAIDDRLAEGRAALRLALALASQHTPLESTNQRRIGSVRMHFLPLDNHNGESPRFRLDPKGRLKHDPEHVCVGRDLVTDAIALVQRRSIWARSSANDMDRTRRLPLEAVRGCEASLNEVSAWVRGLVSDRNVLALIRPLLALDWNQVATRTQGIPSGGSELPDPLQMLFRLVHLPFKIPIGVDGRLQAEVAVRLDPEPLRRLAAGNVDAALVVAVRRLGASGLRPVFHRSVAAPAMARRLAASLAFPISRDEAGRAARLVCKPYDVKDAEERSLTLF